VTFRDIPEAITQGESVEDAMIQARDALETALDFYFDDRRLVPAPSKAKRGERLIELPASLSAKALLLNEMVRQRVRPADLARRLHTTPQEITRLTDVRHRTRIDSIAAALHALGKQLELRVT
jgi:antitoxin HicB